MLAELLARAHGVDDEPEVPTPTSFAVIEEEAFHGMGEAAKRRTDEPTGESELKRGYVAKIRNEVVGHTPKGKPIILPQGVNDLASWGRTIIMFGKFAAKKGATEITYTEVFDSKNAEDIRYVRWVKGQVESASSHRRKTTCSSQTLRPCVHPDTLSQLSIRNISIGSCWELLGDEAPACHWH